MEKADHDLLLKIVSNHPRLKALYNEHTRLEKQVANCERHVAFSASVQLKQNELKKAKLKTKDDILVLLNEYRRTHDEVRIQ